MEKLDQAILILSLDRIIDYYEHFKIDKNVLFLNKDQIKALESAPELEKTDTSLTYRGFSLEVENVGG